MKNALKRIMAALASVVAMLGFAVAANTAMADEANTYRPTINTNGITYNAQTGTLSVPVSADKAVEAGYKHVSVHYNSQQIADVVLAANMDTFKYLGTVDSDNFTLDLKLTDQAKAEASSVQIQVFMSKTEVSSYDELSSSDYVSVLAVDANGNESSYLTYSVPATGAVSSSQTTADTGASVAPYAVAVLLFVIAGIAVFVVRRNAHNR